MDVAALREHFSYFAGFGGLGASNGRNQFLCVGGDRLSLSSSIAAINNT